MTTRSFLGPLQFLQAIPADVSARFQLFLSLPFYAATSAQFKSQIKHENVHAFVLGNISLVNKEFFKRLEFEFYQIDRAYPVEYLTSTISSEETKITDIALAYCLLNKLTVFPAGMKLV